MPARGTDHFMTALETYAVESEILDLQEQLLGWINL